VSLKVIELEINGEIRPVLDIERYEGVLALVRFSSLPVGWIYIPRWHYKILSPDRILDAVDQQLGWALAQVVMKREYKAKTPHISQTDPVSVVVYGGYRPARLKRCLESLQNIEYPSYEIILVDNGMSGSETARIASSFQVRYVKESFTNVSSALHCGAAVASHNILAFTTELGRVDCCWLRSLCRPFIDPKVQAVSGFVAPDELETVTQNQIYYGGYWMYGGTHRSSNEDALLAYESVIIAYTIASGVNMAFRKDMFLSVGTFRNLHENNLYLNSYGMEMFHNVTACGHIIVYEPTALIWYSPARDIHSGRRLAFETGMCMMRYLRINWRSRVQSRLSILRYAVISWLARRIIRRMIRPGNATRALIISELAGGISGAFMNRSGKDESANDRSCLL
jgi:glycosyltransferase involved in cell wall biosynthesis